MPQVEIQDLRVAYGKAKILEGVSMEVEQRELVSVIGPNGAGKTTLLRAISGVAEPQGSVTFEGQRIDHLSPVQVVKRGIIHCPERRRLFPDLSVEDNLKMGAYLRTKDKDGVTRVVPWDIGAYEYIASGGTVYTKSLASSMGMSDLVVVTKPKSTARSKTVTLSIY